MNGWFITVLLILLLVAGLIALYQRIRIALLRSKLEDAMKKSYCASTLLFEGLFRNLGFSWFLILIQEPVGSKGDGRVCAQVSLKGIFAYLPTPSTSPPGNSHIEYSEYMSIHIYLVREDI